MNSSSYTPPQREVMQLWQGRVDDGEAGQALRWHQIIQPWPGPQHSASIEQRPLALIGFASDEGVRRNQGRPGALQGPTALRRVLANTPVLGQFELFEAGDIHCLSGLGEEHNLEQAQQEYADCLSQLLSAGALPIGLGGGHEIAYASFMGLAQYLQQQQATDSAAPSIGIVNFDAHFDLRKDHRPSSGTPFRQIAQECQVRDWPFNYFCLGVSEFANTPALFHRAQQLGVNWVRDEDCSVSQLPQLQELLEQFIGRVDQIYLTVCLDVFPAAQAPGVSAPSARGVDIALVEPLLDQIIHSGKLVLADIAEMNPHFDIDQRTARLGARLVARISRAVLATTQAC